MLKFMPVNGDVDSTDGGLLFRGRPVTYPDPSTGQETEGVALATAMCNESLAGGVVAASVTFKEVDPQTACDLVLWYNPENAAFVTAGLDGAGIDGSGPMFHIRHFTKQWFNHGSAGFNTKLMAGHTYDIRARLRGTRVSLTVDGVDVAAATLPISLPPSQVGVWFKSKNEIEVHDFRIIEPERPRVFVVMQFSTPFNEIHQDVLKSVCEYEQLDAQRADDTYGPGLIIADIERRIDEAKFVIADITPPNPNVYYEVGYARARGKPTILLADKTIEKLPFDVSGFRTLFYENTIAGKRPFEEELRHHIRAILAPPGL